MHNGVGKSGAPDNPHIASPAATVRALNEIQRWFIEETRLGIPVEFTNEGIRGACYRNSTNFPANISLGATWNLDLIENIGSVVARESKALGYRNVYGGGVKTPLAGAVFLMFMGIWCVFVNGR